MVKDSDGNGDSIPDSPWGTPLLGDGDWKSFVSMGNEIGRNSIPRSGRSRDGSLPPPPHPSSPHPHYSPLTLGIVQPTSPNICLALPLIPKQPMTQYHSSTPDHYFHDRVVMGEEGDKPITTMSRKDDGESIYVMQGRRGWIRLWWCLREEREPPSLPPLATPGRGQFNCHG